MPLKCSSKDRDNYNLLQAAHVGPVGLDLARILKTTEGDLALFGIFAKSSEEALDQPTSHSALCVFTLKKMNEKILSGLQDCFDGYDIHLSQGLRQFSDNIYCRYATVSYRLFKTSI